MSAWVRLISDLSGCVDSTGKLLLGKAVALLISICLLGIAMGSWASRYVVESSKVSGIETRVEALEGSDKVNKAILESIYKGLDRIDRNVEETRREVSELKTEMIKGRR